MALQYILIFTSLIPIVNGISPQCYDQRQATLVCDRQLLNLLNEKLAAFNETYNTIDKNNAQELQLLIEQTKAVLCNSSKFVSVECILNNFDVCAEILSDSKIRNTYLSNSMADNYADQSTASAVCAFHKSKYCDYRIVDFNNCYTTITVNIEKVDPTSTELCASSNFDDITCMIDQYKDCRIYMDLNANTALNSSLKQNISAHRWETFTSGAQLCECYGGQACYARMQQQISNNAVPLTSVRNMYTNAVSSVETLCGDNSALICSLKARDSACEYMLEDFDNTRAKINQYMSTLDVVCDDIVKDEMKDNKECIIIQFTDVLHPCMADSYLLNGIDTCWLVQKLYNCLRYAFPNGQCNGNYLGFAYEIIRAKYGTLPVCELSTAMTTTPSLAMTSLFPMILCIYGKYAIS